MRKILITLTVALALPVSALASGDAAAGKAKSTVCAACHGANGKSPIPNYPHLAGQQAAYLELSLKAYKNKERTGANAAIMYGMVANLSDKDIADLAAFYSSLEP